MPNRYRLLQVVVSQVLGATAAWYKNGLHSNMVPLKGAEVQKAITLTFLQIFLVDD